MRLYLSIKNMTFEEDGIEHNIINGMLNEEYAGYDEIIELPNEDKLIKDTMKIIYKKNKDGKDTKEIERKIFIIREQKTWWSFPLYEFKNGKIKKFDYAQYAYFANTERRNMLVAKINELYNPSAEAKLVRKILKKILDHLEIVDENFEKYNNKIEAIIIKNPKEKK